MSILAGIGYSATLVCVGIWIERYDSQSVSRLTHLVRTTGRQIAIAIAGDDKSVSATLSENYATKVSLADVPMRRIDTSRLPLLLKEIPLGGTGEFATSANLIGGALAKVGDSLLVMDKLGNIFVFDFLTGSLRKLDFGTFPNGIRAAILDEDPPPLDAARALYMAYDPAASVLYVSLLKFDVTLHRSRFDVSAISIDQKTLQKTSDWRSIFESEAITTEGGYRNSGGRLLVADNKLYFSVGDFDYSREKLPFTAQSLTSSSGKIFQYDLQTHQVELKSIGHRNPQGLVVTNDGRLLETEHGPEGGDELNAVIDGRNYGWPYRTYGTEYGTFSWPIRPPDQAADAFEQPLYTWIPAPAISPIIQLSNFDEAWNDDLLIGSLKAQSLLRVRLLKDRVLFSEPIWIGHRVRDIVEFKDNIVLMTDDPALVFVTVDRERLRRNVKAAELAMNPVLSKCIVCHHFQATNPSNAAPTLAHIMGRPIASDTFTRYSDGLKRTAGSWDEESLRKFITNPDKFAPGTTMPNLGLSRSDVDGIIAVLSGG